jgi:hypothetical protein
VVAVAANTNIRTQSRHQSERTHTQQSEQGKARTHFRRELGGSGDVEFVSVGEGGHDGIDLRVVIGQIEERIALAVGLRAALCEISVWRDEEEWVRSMHIG